MVAGSPKSASDIKEVDKRVTELVTRLSSNGQHGENIGLSAGSFQGKTLIN